MTRRRVLALLSGGGAKASGHIGAVRALEEAGLRPEGFVATSMGAVIAAGFAAGLGADELLERVAQAGPKGIARAPLAPVGGLWLGSLLRGDALRRAIAAVVPADSFERLDRPLTVTAVDLDTGELICFGAGGRAAPLLDALYASCALPVFYPPAVLDGRRLADGGLRGVVPFEAAAAVPADLVVAVDLGPGLDEPPGRPPPRTPPIVALHTAAVGILMAANTRAQLALWRADPARPPLVYVRPRVERYATFRVDLAREFAEEGRRAMRAALAASGAGS